MKKSAFLLATMLAPTFAFAQAAGGSAIGDKGLMSLGVGILVGLCALGGTLGQGRVGAAAMEGLARNPQARSAMFVPMIIGLVFIESLFIVTWVLGIMLNGKI